MESQRLTYFETNLELISMIYGVYIIWYMIYTMGYHLVYIPLLGLLLFELFALTAGSSAFAQNRCWWGYRGLERCLTPLGLHHRITDLTCFVHFMALDLIDSIFCYIKNKIAWGVLGSFETKIIGLYPQLFMANTNICSLLSHYYWLNPSAWLLIFQL